MTSIVDRLLLSSSLASLMLAASTSRHFFCHDKSTKDASRRQFIAWVRVSGVRNAIHSRPSLSHTHTHTPSDWEWQADLCERKVAPPARLLTPQPPTLVCLPVPGSRGNPGG